MKTPRATYTGKFEHELNRKEHHIEERPVSNQNYGKKASVKWASDDDAGDLLAGILSDTESDATMEQQRIEAEMNARQEEARRIKESDERQRRAEAEARISAEMDRLQEVEKRRTQKIEALKIEDLKESGQWKPPEEAAEVKQAREAQAQMAAAQMAALHAPQPQAPAQQQMAQAPVAVEKKSNVLPLAILGAVLVLVVGAGGIAFALMTGGYKVDNTAYTKAVYSPKDNQILLVEKGFSPLPKEEPRVEEASAASARTARPRTTAAAAAPARPTAAPAQKKDAPKKKGIELDLNFDPFSSGF
ncbi:MAG: hypothetical protein H0U74_11550 [Bradymonadaceae bacterium]|nr:hypothetical protein [Lujinxingiaceae bacterium]